MEGRGLQSLLHPAALLAFTSYTRAEAGADMERFSQHCQQDVEILVNCEENKMRSHRPIRDVVKLGWVGEILLIEKI